MMEAKYLQCRACSREFIDIDDGLFVTCRKCRIPDTRIRLTQHFDTSHSLRGRTRDHVENTYETKFGVDY